MNGKWIWKYGDFEKYHGTLQLLSREERGKRVPSFYEIPYYSHAVRFRKTVVLDKAEEIRLVSEGDACLMVDGVRQNGQNPYPLTPGTHKLTVTVGNAKGMCALKILGDTVFTDESWIADSLDGMTAKAGSSPLCGDSDITPGNYAFPQKEVFPTEDTISNGERILDFGKEVFVSLRLRQLSPDKKITLFYGESRGEIYSDRCVITDTTQGTETITFPPRACRFVRFCGAIDFDVCAYYPYLPLQDISEFRSNTELTKIYNISKYTLELCSQMFFLDGIKRDKWPWNGDVYITARMNYYSFADSDIVRRTLILLRGNPAVVTPPNMILEYSFYWFLTMKEYWLYTGDAEFVLRNYESAKQLMDYYIKNTDKDGFVPHIPGTWLFIDWHDINKNGAVCAVQMLFGAALQCMAEFAELCNRPEEKHFYEDKFADISAKIRRLFFDEAIGGYVSSVVDGKRTPEIRRHQNYLAILFGYADERQTEIILKRVLFQESVPKITTPFFKFFEYEVLCRCGYIEQAFDAMRAYFGGMIRLGATTMWEEFDDSIRGEAQYAMYDEPYDKSLCHAWGAGPLYFIGKYLAGVSPTAPGYRTFRVSPCLTLGDFSTTIPVPGGKVSVKYLSGTLTICSDIPGGTLLLDEKTFDIPTGKPLLIQTI